MKRKRGKVFDDRGRGARSKGLPDGNPIKLSLGMILLGYVLVPNFTPQWMALDNNAPKFLALAVLNLLSFLVLLADSDIKRKPGLMSGFFRTGPGLALTGLLLMTLLSFSSASNRIESVIELSKFISLFAATFMVSVILAYDPRYLRMITVLLAGILIIDSVSVYYHISEFIRGNLHAIPEIKTVYSNKNILASAIYVKIPAALWLMIFEKGWMKQIGIAALFFGFLSTLFLSTRAFYLGLIIATLLFLLYSAYNYNREREKRHIHLLLTYLVALLLAMGIFTLIRVNFYPASGNRHTQGVGQQLSTIITGDASTSFRLETWIWSAKMIKSNPLLGVGAGNWKVAVLEHENRTKPDFAYAFTSHNDFLETAAECGILGGLLYVAIYASVFWSFLRSYLGRLDHESIYKSLFFAATGVFFYSIDAFFNFPGDRPEILTLFALYLGTGIASIHLKNRATQKNEEATVKREGFVKVPSMLNETAVVLPVAAFAIVIPVFHLNFESSKLQRLVYLELMTGTLKEPADRFLEGFPGIPNISHWGESVSTLKGRYLIQEKRFEEALDVMENDPLNPFDGTREYLMAICFLKLERFDQALYYAQQSFAVKPNYFHNFQLMIEMLEKQGQSEQAIGYLDAYISQNKGNSSAWILLTNAHYRVGNLDKAYALIQEAIKLLPEDSLIKRQQRFLGFRKLIATHRHLFDTAMGFYRTDDFSRSLPYFTQYIDSVPPEAEAFRMRAMAYYHLQQFQHAISDIDRAIELGVDESSLIDLRKACYQGLGSN